MYSESEGENAGQGRAHDPSLTALLADTDQTSSDASGVRASSARLEIKAPESLAACEKSAVRHRDGE